MSLGFKLRTLLAGKFDYCTRKERIHNLQTMNLYHKLINYEIQLKNPILIKTISFWPIIFYEHFSFNLQPSDICVFCSVFVQLTRSLAGYTDRILSQQTNQ